MTTSPWDKQRYELEVINNKFSECLERSKQLSECGEPYRYDYAALTRQNDDLQRLLHVHEGQLAKMRCELAKKEAECADEQLRLEKSQNRMQELEKRITDTEAERTDTMIALNDAEEDLSKKTAGNKVLRERNKKLSRELDLERQSLQRQHDSLELQLQQEQLQKAAVEESVVVSIGQLESSGPGWEEERESLDRTLDGFMAVEKQLMKKSANAKTDKMKQLLDNWRQELKQLEVDTKQKTRENFDKIKQNCDDKLRQLRNRTRHELGKLQDASREILERINRLAPQLRELHAETAAQETQISQLEDALDEQTKDVEDVGITFELCYYKVLLEDLARQREDALSQKNSEPDEANSDSQRLSTVEEGSVVTPRRAAGHSHGQRDERSARWSLTSSTSFDRSLGEVKALVDATEATSARMLQNRLATTSSEC